MTPVSDPGFDLRIAKWLEADPVIAPPDLLRTVESALPSIPQRRVVRLPRRLPTMNRFALIAATVALLALAGVGLLTAGSRSTTPAPTPAPTAEAAVATASPTPRLTPDITPLRGQILIEHFGNAPDGSETDVGADVHRLFLADPNDMSGTAMRELLPGTPANGKLSADVSADGSEVAFEDWADPSSVYVVGIDGAGFRKVTPDGCDCSEWDPAFDPTGKRLVYGHAEAGRAWLEIRDLASGTTTKLTSTEGPASDSVPEAPSWSPDGTRIAFVRLTWSGQPTTMGRVHYHTGKPTADVLSIVTVEGGATVDLPTPDWLPGDPDWSPDGSLLVFTNGPTTMFDDSTTNHPILTIRPDGTGLAPVMITLSSSKNVFEGDSANWTPDGRILSTFNFFTLIRPDGTGLREVDPNAPDNAEDPVGYVYVGHWVGTP